jgi:hypothetical protein
MSMSTLVLTMDRSCNDDEKERAADPVMQSQRGGQHNMYYQFVDAHMSCEDAHRATAQRDVGDGKHSHHTFAMSY